MKTHRQAIFIALVTLLGLAVIGLFWTSSWNHAPMPGSAANAAAAEQAKLVDQRPLETAQKLAPLAVTPEEKEFAQSALRTADREVDLAFDSALRNAAEHPAPLTPEAQAQLERVKQIQARVKTDQNDIARLKELVTKAPEDKRDSLQEQLELAQAQLELDQDELDDAQQDLIRAGGDTHSIIQRMREEHEASLQHTADGAHADSTGGTSATAYEQTQSHSLLAQFRAWQELSAKEKQLLGTQQEAKAQGAELAEKHKALEPTGKGPALEELAPGPPALTSPSASSPAAPAENGAKSAAAATKSFLQRRSENQKDMAELDKRIEDLQELDQIYGNWGAFVRGRELVYLRGLLVSTIWILVIGLLMLLADPLLHRFYSRLAPENKQMLTLRSVARFTANAAGVVLILLVAFGAPNQLATVVALVGAGLTVALKDFIVGFFGWFALMGRNGIRIGDWVEIDGVGGEVLEVGLLHTVLLETGNWSDAGHPTGRKVTFVNSFAIEGHYFNFSTAGQWLWDSIEMQIPSSADPYSAAEAIQKIVAAETSANARLAEQEWQRVVPSHVQRRFSAEPAITVRPTGAGVNVTVRYITRAHERHAVRARLYRAIVELLHEKRIPQPVAGGMAPQSAGGSR